MTEADSPVLTGEGSTSSIDELVMKYMNQGRQSEQAGDRLAAIESYEAAYAASPDMPELCFRLAYNLDLVGEEDDAMRLYEQIVQQPKPHLNALVNLAVLYEDREKYVQAERCIRQVLATDPNHLRAKLFIKDIQASKDMLIDDEAEREAEKHTALLEVPVTDFDLTIRTRNYLRKMEIRTLGDLLKITEAELRGYKNFGDASIEEIKAMLSQKNLRMGQSIDTQQSVAKQAIYDQLSGEQEASGDTGMMSRPVMDMNLSVRARKALSMLNIQSIGDLCIRTEAELMGVKNFGMTSLLEIKDRLIEMGLNLRQLAEEDEQL